MNLSNIFYIGSIIILPLLFAITMHEAAHGWVAAKFGDKTALMLGRVSANPLKHIDMFGTVIMPLLLLFFSHFSFAFGYAKPVPVNYRNLRQVRRDSALVAAAGPAANFLMALAWGAIAKLALIFGGNVSSTFGLQTINFLATAGKFGVSINCILMLFNLLPLPPLDGSRIVSSLLSPRIGYLYNKIEPYGVWILLGGLALMYLTHTSWIIITPFMSVAKFMLNLFGL